MFHKANANLGGPYDEEQWLSEGGPQADSTSITCGLARNADSWVHPLELQKLQAGLFQGSLKFEDS